MRILYFTNKDIVDWEVIPLIIKRNPDSVLTFTGRISVGLAQHNIDFVVSDRARNLINAECIKFLKGNIINLILIFPESWIQPKF